MRKKAAAIRARTQIDQPIHTQWHAFSIGRVSQTYVIRGAARKGRPVLKRPIRDEFEALPRILDSI